MRRVGSKSVLKVSLKVSLKVMRASTAKKRKITANMIGHKMTRTFKLRKFQV